MVTFIIIIIIIIIIIVLMMIIYIGKVYQEDKIIDRSWLNNDKLH